MIEFKPWSPVRGAQECLDGTSQVYKEIAHQEKPTAKKHAWQIEIGIR